MLNESLYDLFKNISNSDSEPIKLTFKQEAILGIWCQKLWICQYFKADLQNVISFNENYRENRDNILKGCSI